MHWFLFKARFGEVGGNTLGYYGCSFSTCGNALIAHGYHGSFQLWIKDDQVWIWKFISCNLSKVIHLRRLFFIYHIFKFSIEHKNIMQKKIIYCYIFPIYLIINYFCVLGEMVCICNFEWSLWWSWGWYFVSWFTLV